MENRFSTMTEVRNVLWPDYETPEWSAAQFEARSPAGAQARKVKIAQRRDLGLYLAGTTHHAAPRDRDARTVPAMRYTVRPASSWLLRIV